MLLSFFPYSVSMSLIIDSKDACKALVSLYLKGEAW